MTAISTVPVEILVLVPETETVEAQELPLLKDQFALLLPPLVE